TKGWTLRSVSRGGGVRSDVITVERIMLDLAPDAVSYTAQGGVLIGCRRRGARVRIDVCDSGVGIPENQQRNVFAEFYRLGGPDRGRTGGFGFRGAGFIGLWMVFFQSSLLISPNRKRKHIRDLIPLGRLQQKMAGYDRLVR